MSDDRQTESIQLIEGSWVHAMVQNASNGSRTSPPVHVSVIAHSYGYEISLDQKWGDRCHSDTLRNPVETHI